MRILVPDTSVLIDLERGGLITCAFELEVAFAVPDVLYARELKDAVGDSLIQLGLKVESLDGEGVALAQRHRENTPRLSLIDCLALALAQMNKWLLLSGDAELRATAQTHGVECQTNSGLRIDHLLLSPLLKPRLKDAGVDSYIRDAPHASDHAPVWIELLDTTAKRQSSARNKAALKRKKRVSPR